MFVGLSEMEKFKLEFRLSSRTLNWLSNWFGLIDLKMAVGIVLGVYSAGTASSTAWDWQLGLQFFGNYHHFPASSFILPDLIWQILKTAISGDVEHTDNSPKEDSVIKCVVWCWNGRPIYSSRLVSIRPRRYRCVLQSPMYLLRIGLHFVDQLEFLHRIRNLNRVFIWDTPSSSVLQQHAPLSREPCLLQSK